MVIARGGAHRRTDALAHGFRRATLRLERAIAPDMNAEIDQSRLILARLKLLIGLEDLQLVLSRRRLVAAHAARHDHQPIHHLGMLQREVERLRAAVG